jgi:isocitrate dehydrogenase
VLWHRSTEFLSHPTGKRSNTATASTAFPITRSFPFIEGDGTGRDIWKASVRVFDAAVEIAYGGKRRVAWYEVFAGEKAMDRFKTWLPDDTVARFANCASALRVR